MELNAGQIGGYTGGTIEQLRKAASMLDGHKLALGFRLSICPATSRDYIQAAEEGILTKFIDFGAQINAAGDHSVVIQGPGAMGHKERLVTTGLYTFAGSMGCDDAEVYTGSVETVMNASFCEADVRRQRLWKRNSVEKSGSSEMILTPIPLSQGKRYDPDRNEMKKYAFELLKPEFGSTVQPGDILVAGTNFGCGSSREQAATVLSYNGVRCIIAKSFARIFFRNAFNSGILLLTCDQIQDVCEGEILLL